jgi:hypothetical protein
MARDPFKVNGSHGSCLPGHPTQQREGESHLSQEARAETASARETESHWESAKKRSARSVQWIVEGLELEATRRGRRGVVDIGWTGEVAIRRSLVVWVTES